MAVKRKTRKILAWLMVSLGVAMLVATTYGIFVDYEKKDIFHLVAGVVMVLNGIFYMTDKFFVNGD